MYASRIASPRFVDQTTTLPASSSEPAPVGITVVVPAYNEYAGITQAVEAIAEELKLQGDDWEIIVVDDGSKDMTFARLCELADADSRIKGISFSRNFGKEAALLAGLRLAKGMAVITMDADLQHPTALISTMLEKWRDGADIVHAVKRDRSGDSVGKKLAARCINELVSRLGNINLHNASDFKLLDRQVVDIIAHQLPEKERFFRGLTSWLGFSEIYIEFDVPVRKEDKGKWGLWQLVDLSVTALTSFTSLPLRAITLLGALTLGLGIIIGGDALWSWLAGRAVSGYVTIIVTLLLLGSFVMISLGIIGEYIAKIYEETKARPSFLIKSSVGLDQSRFNTGGRITARSHNYKNLQSKQPEPGI